MNDTAAVEFRAGADARVITPDVSQPVYLAGFDSNRRALAIHDDLFIRTVAVTDGRGEPFVLTAVDSIGLPRVKKNKGSRVVAATHTHHGPDTIGLWGPEEHLTGRDTEYVQRVRDAIAASQAAAIHQLAPARLAAGSTPVASLVENFRDPEIVDDEFSVLRVTSHDGKTIATVMSYPCHPEVVAPENTDITADYAGHLCREVEARDGGVAVFVSGGLGGMLSPRTEIHTHAEAQRFGVVLATAVSTALAGPPIEAGPVSFARREITIPIQNPNYVLAEQMALVEPAERRDGQLLTEVSLAQVGPVMFAAVPGELLPKLGLRLKTEMRLRGASVPVIVGLADDELGYILPEEDFVFPADYRDPGKQYEESMSVGPRTGPIVVDALMSLISEGAHV